MVITYPRRCSTCGKNLKNRSSFSRHRKYCGKKTEPVSCLYCETTFKRKDDLSRHISKFHSKAAKRKAEDTAELVRMELIHSNKVTNIDSQLGGAMTTRGIKRATNEGDNKFDVKVPKPEDTDPTAESTAEYGGGLDPLYVADFNKLGLAKRWKQNTLVNQKFHHDVRPKTGT